MEQVFLRQAEAWEFVRGIDDPVAKLLTELAVAHALSFLANDADYQARLRDSPLDLLTFARAVHAFFRHTKTVQGTVDGSIKSIEDLDPFSAGR